MKFGGSSLASPSAIRKVVEIIRGEEKRQRLVVVSAHGDTTDWLEQILKHTARAETYLSWKAIKELREYHFGLAEELLSNRTICPVDLFLREIFRDLHVRMLEVCDGERSLKAEDRAWVLSIGEQVSSRLITSVLCDSGVSAQHVDARQLIVTDDDCCQAHPQYWETYACFRWAMPSVPEHSVAVIGGFIGATENGCTTILGRGGSDLTATIAGAALNAEEIQIWKDVDGMLTCDPRRKPDGLLVKHLSYQEAGTLAQNGAAILHPNTVAPAERLRIPINLRNTFCPGSEGTRIGMSTLSFKSDVKSIACRAGQILLDISAGREDGTKPQLSALAADVQTRGTGVKVLSCSPERLLIAVDGQTDFSALKVIESGCLEVRVKGAQTLITMVGEHAPSSCARIRKALGNVNLIIAGECCLYAIVEDSESSRFLESLHAALFENPDPEVFSRRTLTSNVRADKITQRLAEEHNSVMPSRVMTYQTASR